ncbi:MAG TPA: YHYH protein, partial [Tepidisphaeraceae bacterium]|nr:YHYH protein [Tepidisphaeraceae bacterium]
MTAFRCIAIAAVVSIPVGLAGAHPGHDEPVEVSSLFAADAPVVTLEERDGFRHITSNGLPGHATGAFPNRGNPHRISEQNYRFRVTLTPAPAGQPVSIPRGVVGIAINGVVFDPGTAEAWRNDVNSGWNIEGIHPRQGGLLGMDQNNAHVQPTGAYHYHGIPVGLVAQLQAKHGKDKMLLLGWAADGYPIYAPMAHENADDASSKLRAMTSSYRIKPGTRPGGNDGPGGR